MDGKTAAFIIIVAVFTAAILAAEAIRPETSSYGGSNGTRPNASIDIVVQVNSHHTITVASLHVYGRNLSTYFPVNVSGNSTKTLGDRLTGLYPYTTYTASLTGEAGPICLPGTACPEYVIEINSAQNVTTGADGTTTNVTIAVP